MASAPASIPKKGPNHIAIIMLSLLIATVLGVVCLLIFLLINQKWKPYNIDVIEFKTKYYSNKVEEPLLEAGRDSAIATADMDEASVLVDVIATQDLAETKTTDAEQSKKSITKTKSKKKSNRNSNEDVGLLESDEEHLDFSMQHEMN